MSRLDVPGQVYEQHVMCTVCEVSRYALRLHTKPVAYAPHAYCALLPAGHKLPVLES